MIGHRKLPDFMLPIAKSICGCGAPEDAYGSVLQHLELRELPYERRPKEWPYGDARDLFMAYVLDSWGYTEHGGSIGGSWLSESGKGLLRFLKENGPDWQEKWSWVDKDDVHWGTFP